VIEIQTFKSLSWWENRLSNLSWWENTLSKACRGGKTDFQKPVVMEKL
jgi:hypothetical protein